MRPHADVDARSNQALTAAIRRGGGEVPLPEAALRLDAAARRVDTHYEGRRVAWRVWGEGPPVVLVHGAFGSWTHWIKTIPHLCRSRLVIVPDMPGFGDSDLPAGDDLLEAIPRALIHGLRAMLEKAARLDIVGFSFGSVMAGEVAAGLDAADEPLAGGSLVLVAPAGLGVKVADFTSLARPRAGMTPAEITAVHRHNMAVILFKDPAKIDDSAVLLQMANTARAREQGRPYSRSDALMRAAQRIRARRVLAVWGDGDAYANRSPADYEAAVGRLRPDIRLHRIAAAGHWVQYEAAEAFNSFLATALANQETS